MKVRLIKSFKFDAAHHLPCFDETHKCHRLHGHTFKVDIVIEGDMPESEDVLVDFHDIKKVIKPLEQQLDHNILNEITGLECPTVENICKWLWDKMKPDLEILSMVRVWETENNCCEYWGE